MLEELIQTCYKRSRENTTIIFSKANRSFQILKAIFPLPFQFLRDLSGGGDIS